METSGNHLEGNCQCKANFYWEDDTCKACNTVDNAGSDGSHPIGSCACLGNYYWD